MSLSDGLRHTLWLKLRNKQFESQIDYNTYLNISFAQAMKQSFR